MTRVSQAELYDNRDVIKQIYDAKGAAETAEQAATDAASSATAAQSSADAAAREAVAAGDLAQSAADDAAKVNQFDSRIKSSVTHISTTGTADGVSIGYATDGKPSPLTVVDIPVLSGMGAGVVTPAQMQDISDQLDTLGRGQDAIKSEYLKRHAIHEEQDITGRVDFKISPLTTTLKPGEYTDHDGHRVPDVASVRADPVVMKTAGTQHTATYIFNRGDFSITVPVKTAEGGQRDIAKVYDDTETQVFKQDTISRSADGTTVYGPKVFSQLADGSWFYTWLRIDVNKDGSSVLMFADNKGHKQEIARLGP